MSNFKITTLTAFVAIDPENGDEGVMGFKTNNGWIPLVCADEARIKQMLPIAEQISSETGTKYRILQFSTREDVTDQVKDQYRNDRPHQTQPAEH